MSIVQNILKIAKENKVNNQQLCKILNTNSSKIYDWKVGKSKPSADDVFTLANYFDVSIDYLVGRTNTNKQTNNCYSNNISDNSFSNFVQGNGTVTVGSFSVGSVSNSQNTDHTKKEMQQNNLSNEETEILNIYRSLNIRDKSTFLNFILNMEKEENN